MSTNFVQILQGFASIVDSLESKVSSPDNISNWVTQLVGNGEFTHALELSGKILGDTISVEFPANFMPASSKGNSNAYLESCRVGEFGKDANVDDICLILLAYNIGWLLLGKPLSAVNAGRGLIIRQLLSDLKVLDLTIKIKDVSFGGDAPKRDIEINQTELVALVEFQAIRSNRIMLLQNRSGKTHHANSATKVNLVKKVKKI